jgi:hypothetical protein
MSVRKTLLPAVLAFGMSAPFVAGSASHNFTFFPAHRIVGLWTTDGLVGPCGGTPAQPVRNYLLFHSGGTVTENIPPLTVRNQGLGVWSYNPFTGWYTMNLRFDRFLNGAYNGYTQIERHLRLSPGGLETTGPVKATLYGTDGAVVQELCGEAVSVRVL